MAESIAPPSPLDAIDVEPSAVAVLGPGLKIRDLCTGAGGWSL
jgi:hypothetical protein